MSERENKPIWKVILEQSSKINDKEWKKLPKDGAENLDHYLYGAEKEKTMIEGKELLDIAEEVQTQDNRATKHPLFCLQILVRDIGYDPAYADHTVWIRTVDGECEEVPEGTDGAEEVGYRDRWETVMVAFTAKGIYDYMSKNGHNVRELAHNGETRIYVESLYRCQEMIRIREYLMGI